MDCSSSILSFVVFQGEIGDRGEQGGTGEKVRNTVFLYMNTLIDPHTLSKTSLMSKMYRGLSDINFLS